MTTKPPLPASPSPEVRDWRDTLFLPQTGFPMKAQLAAQEPARLAQWEEMRLYQRLRAQSKGREKFILHDGPPYANGDIHMGHALNKILKDVFARAQQMQGKDAPYVPGWDCHGLPIEWKVEEQYRASRQRKEDIDQLAFRAACRRFAERWMRTQKTQFQRLGILADWARAYSTMDFAAEADIMEEFHKIAMAGRLYRGLKPAMWSVVEKTALADAEIEYREHETPQAWVAFAVREGAEALRDAACLIWTTTPWTLPANQAVAWNPALSYGLYEDAAQGRRFVLCDGRADAVAHACGGSWTRLGDADLRQIKSLAHPLHAKGYDAPRPLLAADFVDEESGTGLVHIAPAHGPEDFALGQKAGLKIAPTLDEDGRYHAQLPLFAGLEVLTETGAAGRADAAVLAALKEAGALAAQTRLAHSYPHSWRSKAPLIFRLTRQWFISMEKKNLRAGALAALKHVRFVPRRGANRLTAMLQTRPDWLVSRQRLWGVPLGIFVHSARDEVLRDEAVHRRIRAAVREKGADAWFTTPPQQFLGRKYRAEDWQKVDDILDVWFDSGSTHAFVLQQHPDLARPADVYLEGTDQHRGWFQSSLLASQAAGHRGAPYRQLVTHGFLLNQKGRKMSKSEGDVLDPMRLAKRDGAEILRLWVASTDYQEDVRFSEAALQTTRDAYRKTRNTLRFLLGNLHGFTAAERVPLTRARLPELERYVLQELAQLDGQLRQAWGEFALRQVWQALFHFMSETLSALYFDVRKDSLYCDAADSPTRRACRTVMERIFACLSAWLAPILCFTAEEAWDHRPPSLQKDGPRSIHLAQFPALPRGARTLADGARWRAILACRRVVLGALEVARQERAIGSSLEAAPILYVQDEALYQHLAERVDMAELCLTSQLDLKHGSPPRTAFRLPDVPHCGAVMQKARGKKCARSWRIRPDVGSDAEYPDLSARDAAVVAAKSAS